MMKRPKLLLSLLLFFLAALPGTESFTALRLLSERSWLSRHTGQLQVVAGLSQVSIDQPIVNLAAQSTASGGTLFGGAAKKAINSRPLVLLVIVLCYTMLFRWRNTTTAATATTSSSSDKGQLVASNPSSISLSTTANVATATTSTTAQPMTFAENNGWDVCTYLGKERLGTTSFFQYHFSLPNSNDYLDLQVAEPIRLCVMDDDDDETVLQAVFHPFESAVGSFSLLESPPPLNPSALEKTATIGQLTRWNDCKKSQLLSVLDENDAVALQPTGESTLSSYYYPGVDKDTDVVLFLVHSTGMGQVLSQIEALLEEDETIQLNVVWINDCADDFDILDNRLERLCFAHSERLAVSCLVSENDGDDDYGVAWESSNDQLDKAVDPYQPRSLAVVAGPGHETKQAVLYLQQRLHYPRESICVN